MSRHTNAARNDREAIADAIRIKVADMQAAYDSGNLSAQIDLWDLVDLLLGIADQIDPEHPG